jgi:hypothetical protein
MKKALSVLLTLAVLLSLAYQTVFAAEGTLELLETRNDARGNVIFVFRFTGDFKKNDFKGGKVFFGDESFPMGCNIVDKEEGIVQCTTSRATAGQYVNINLAGFVFNTFVPLRTGGGGGGSSTICYNIYDLFEGDQDLYWSAFDVLCSDNPPSGLINHPDPFGGTNNYNFDGQTPCYDLIVEDAYYPFCGF